MSIIVDTIPVEDVQGVEDSYWSAAFSPIIFGLIRKDFMVTASANNAGYLQITISSTTGLTVADILFLQDESGGHECAYYSIRSVDSSTQITLELDYAATIGSLSWINLFTGRENYYLIVNVYAYVDSVTFLQSVLRLTPSPNGIMNFDVSSAVHTLFEIGTLPSKSNYTGYNAITEGYAVPFQVKYVEMWQDSDNSEIDVNIAHAFYGLAAAKQIGDPYGSNMGDYVLLDNYEAKFLTKFVEPVNFNGMPFAISYLPDLDITLKSCRREIIQKTAAGATVTTIDNAIGDGASFMNRVNMLPIPHATGDTVAYSEAKLYYSTFDLTETIKIIHDNCLDTDGVMLTWANELGGRDYWLFKHHNEYTFEISEVQLFTKHTTDLKVADTVQDVYKKNFKEVLTIGADNIDMINKDGFRSLFMSPKVSMLMNPATWQSGEPIWNTVVIAENTWKLYNSDQEKFNVSFDIILPTMNLVTQ